MKIKHLNSKIAVISNRPNLNQASNCSNLSIKRKTWIVASKRIGVENIL